MKLLKPIIIALAFIGALVLVYTGMRATGYKGLSMMMIGLAIILFELYLYNRQYQ